MTGDPPGGTGRSPGNTAGKSRGPANDPHRQAFGNSRLSGLRTVRAGTQPAQGGTGQTGRACLLPFMLQTGAGPGRRYPQSVLHPGKSPGEEGAGVQGRRGAAPEGMSTIERTGREEWTYLGFRIRRHKGNRFTFRTRVCRSDVALGGRMVTLSAPSLTELRWKIDRSISEGGVPPRHGRV